METTLFYLFAALTLVCALLVVANPFSRNPVTSAMFLVLTIISMAGLFVLLHAFFLAAVQVLVYAGAIMVLFLFVIMLLNLGERDPGESPRWSPSRVVGFLAGLGLLAELLVLRTAAPPEAIRLPAGSYGCTSSGRSTCHHLPPQTTSEANVAKGSSSATRITTAGTSTGSSP